MATPNPAPSDASIEPAFENQIELGDGLDLPVVTLPVWATKAIADINALALTPADVALDALARLIEPIRLHPEGTGKQAVREALNAKQAAIRAARNAASARQPLAVVPPPVPPVVPAAPVVDTRPALESPRVFDGSWAPMRGDRLAQRSERGDGWACRIEHAAGDGPGVGSLVRLYRNGRNRGSMHVITSVLRADGLTTFGTVRDADAADQRPRPVATGSAPVAAPSIVASAPIPLSSMMPDAIPESLIPAASAPAATVETELASIATEGAARAAELEQPSTRIEPTTRGTGSNADSGASVGIFERPRSERVFRVQDGPRATVAERTRLLTERELVAGAIAADGWLQVSWTGEGSTTHGAVNDALIAVGRESDAPGEPSGEHYAGKAVESMRSRDYDVKRLPKSACPQGVKARWLIGRALQGTSNVQAGDAYGTAIVTVQLMDDGTLDFDGNMVIATEIRSRYAASLAKVTLKSDTLTPWLGKVLRTRHGAVKRGHCWYVPPGHAMAVRALIGGAEYAAAVKEWSDNGGNGPLPKFDKGSIGDLWGDHELMSVNTGGDLLSSLTRGLANDVERIERELATQTELAKERARDNATKKASKIHNATEAFIAAEGEAAFKRATISGVVAAGMLRDLGTVAARTSGYALVLGEASTAGLTTRIAALRQTLEALTDDTSVRGAMLELE